MNEEKFSKDQKIMSHCDNPCFIDQKITETKIQSVLMSMATDSDPHLLEFLLNLLRSNYNIIDYDLSSKPSLFFTNIATKFVVKISERMFFVFLDIFYYAHWKGYTENITNDIITGLTKFININLNTYINNKNYTDRLDKIALFWSYAILSVNQKRIIHFLTNIIISGLNRTPLCKLEVLQNSFSEETLNKLKKNFSTKSEDSISARMVSEEVVSLYNALAQDVGRYDIKSEIFFSFFEVNEALIETNFGRIVSNISIKSIKNMLDNEIYFGRALKAMNRYIKYGNLNISCSKVNNWINSTPSISNFSCSQLIKFLVCMVNGSNIKAFTTDVALSLAFRMYNNVKAVMRIFLVLRKVTPENYELDEKTQRSFMEYLDYPDDSVFTEAVEFLAFVSVKDLGSELVGIFSSSINRAFGIGIPRIISLLLKIILGFQQMEEIMERLDYQMVMENYEAKIEFLKQTLAVNFTAYPNNFYAALFSNMTIDANIRFELIAFLQSRLRSKSVIKTIPNNILRIFSAFANFEIHYGLGFFVLLSVTNKYYKSLLNTTFFQNINIIKNIPYFIQFKIKQFYNNHSHYTKEPIIDSISSLREAFQNEYLDTLYRYNIFKKALSYIDQIDDETANVLVRRGLECLESISYTNHGCFVDEDEIPEFSKEERNITIVFKDNSYNYKCVPTETVSMLINILNMNNNKKSLEELLRKVGHSEFWEIVKNDIQDNQAILVYILHVLKKINYSVNGCGMNDYIYDHQQNFIIKVKEDCPMKFETTPLNIPELYNGKLKSVLNFLKAIHQKFPEMKMHSDVLEKIIFISDDYKKMLKGKSIFLSIIKDFPFLFSFKYRMIAFQIASMYRIKALSLIQKEHFNTEMSINGPAIKICIERNKIWERGRLLINTLCMTTLNIYMSFNNEDGNGRGVTNEFFALMGQEFSKNERKMWISESDGIFAFHPQGLFPRPDSDPTLFFELGVLCGKAVQHGSVIPVPINPAFVKLLLMQSIEPQEVDHQMYKILSGDHAGLFDLEFVFPGTEFELIPNGKNIFVDENNYKVYIEKVTDVLKGKFISTQIENFRNGLSVNLRRGLWNLLTAEEFTQFIIGKIIKLSKSELQKFVKVRPPLEVKEKRVEWLFEVIEELNSDEQQLFISFVTGTTRLPIGGLEALSPPLKLTMFDRKCFPVAHTCFNHLKVGRYDTKDETRYFLQKAINECHDSFDIV